MNSVFFFSSRRRHTRWNCDWSSDVCSSDLQAALALPLSDDDDVAAPAVDIGRDERVTVGRLGIDHVTGPRAVRSEERRVGKESRWRGSTGDDKKEIDKSAARDDMTNQYTMH